VKRTLAFIALLIGSILLPLHTGTSLAAKPRFAREESVQTATKRQVLAITAAPLKPRIVRKAPTRTVKPIGITASVPNSAPSPSPATSPRTNILATPPRIPSSWEGSIPTLVLREKPKAPVASLPIGDGLKAVDEAVMTDRHRQLAKTVLGMLPRDCQEKLFSFSVLYDNPKHRGLAGKGVIILAGNVPDNEFIGLLLHEGLGHFADLTCFNGNAVSGNSPFIDAGEVMFNDDPSVAFYSLSWSTEKTRTPDSRVQDFVSGYALSDTYEDFAESVAYYFLQEEAFAERARTNPVLAGKLAWLRAHYPKNGIAITGSAWDGKIPWDATKVAYDWSL
jgi:hypothetical protein